MLPTTKWVTVNQVAEEMGITPKALRRRIEDGRASVPDGMTRQPDEHGRIRVLWDRQRAAEWLSAHPEHRHPF